VSTDILDGVVTVTVAAAKHGCSDTTIRRAIAAGDIPARMVGKVLFIRMADVDRWARSRSNGRQR
jgi:excisionase family DNA binding protein